MTRATTFAHAAIAAGLLAALAAGPADARRGGSFGSRGSRTYSAPRTTRLAPYETGGMHRSMTPRGAETQRPAAPYAASQPYAPRRGVFGGFGGGLIGGLLAGGLFGALPGHGWGGGGWGAGGGGGLLATLIQLAIIGGLVWLAFRLFRGRPQSVAAPAGWQRQAQTQSAPPWGGAQPSASPWGGGQSAASPQAAGEDIALDDRDQATFERLLIDLQDAFGREDYGRLRAICTPEIMSYLAEELSENATHGRRNEVTGTRLLDGEVSEAWREGDADYATIAMRYESVETMRDRATGTIVEGDGRPSVTTELWTFVRRGGGDWQVSAIQET